MPPRNFGISVYLPLFYTGIFHQILVQMKLYDANIYKIIVHILRDHSFLLLLVDFLCSIKPVLLNEINVFSIHS